MTTKKEKIDLVKEAVDEFNQTLLKVSRVVTSFGVAAATFIEAYETAKEAAEELKS